jgi:hypothetical protein
MGTAMRPKIGKKVFVIVSVVALLFLAAGAVAEARGKINEK